MIITKVIWPKHSGAEVHRQQLLPDMAKTISPDFESRLTVMLDSDNNLASIRTWPSEEVAQSWIDYIVANFEVVDATISQESEDIFENATILKTN